MSFDAADPSVGGGVPKVGGLLAKPEGVGPFPAVVLLHSCGGVRPSLSRDWSSFFVDQGYVALIVDSFGSRGLGPCPNGFAGLGSGIMPYEALASDAHGALDYLESRPFVRKGHTAVVGYSLGGITIHFAILPVYAKAMRAPAFKAAVSLYGPCAVGVGMPKLSRSPLPLLEIIGEKDERTLRHCKELLPADASTRLHVLPGAYHGFDIAFFTTLRRGHAGAPMLYSHEATQTARALVRAFLAKHLGN